VAAARWSIQQVLALAPDAASVKAARALTGARAWSELGCTESLVFGKFQGSAKAPYQVTVDLTEPAFSCSCPSRKFPCKHGLALLLLWVEHGDAVGDASVAADFAGEWARSRQQRAQARAAKKRQPAEVVDPEAQARRQAEREAAMTTGLEQLERWLCDLVRQGLAGARRLPYAFWDAMAARLVDAQLPGLAERVREVGGSVVARDDWADALLVEAARWQLAGRAWRRRDALPPVTVADLRAYLGWPWRADQVARFSTQHDRWVVVGVRQGQDGRITSQRTWLWGQSSGRWLVLLDFAAAGASLQVASVVGSVVEDEVTVYPGSEPSRAVLSGRQRVVGAGAVPASLPVDPMVDQLASWLAANPWCDRLPVALAGAVLVEDHGRWWFEDASGARLPMAPLAQPWMALALSGGAPMTVFAEWEAGVVFPASVAPSGLAVPV
jgi:hypothetical protein